jgi:hypothetical protein
MMRAFNGCFTTTPDRTLERDLNHAGKKIAIQEQIPETQFYLKSGLDV